MLVQVLQQLVIHYRSQPLRSEVVNWWTRERSTDRHWSRPHVLASELHLASSIHCSTFWFLRFNRVVSQIRAPLAACRESTGKLWQLCKVLYVFEHKTQYLLIQASYTRIVVFWHIGNQITYPRWFRRVKFVVIPPRFVWQQYLWNIAIQPAVGRYNSWANLRCSSCSLLGEKNLCEMGLLNGQYH